MGPVHLAEKVGHLAKGRIALLPPFIRGMDPRFDAAGAIREHATSFAQRGILGSLRPGAAQVP